MKRPSASERGDVPSKRRKKAINNNDIDADGLASDIPDGSFPSSFRSLVVVPGSHKENLFPDTSGDLPAENNKLDRTLKSIEKRSDAGRQQAEALRKQAISLNVRSACQKLHIPSCMVLWNSACLHQGLLTVDSRVSGEQKSDFKPILVEPKVFTPESTAAWKQHLQEHGYVVVGPIVNHLIVENAAYLLEQDLRKMRPNDSITLETVRDEDLPSHQNSGLRHRGLPHGEFAWFLRTQRAVIDIWWKLHGTKKVIGAPAVVALSPPMRSAHMKDSIKQFSSKCWLHCDFFPKPPKQLYQSTVYIFPTRCRHWSRVGLMTCMVPSNFLADSSLVKSHTDRKSLRTRVQLNLLAGSILGAAAKCPAGLVFGHLQKVGEGYGSEGLQVLRSELRPGLTDDEVKKLTNGKFDTIEKLQATKLGGDPERNKREEIMTLGLHVLKQIVHPRVVKYCCS